MKGRKNKAMNPLSHSLKTRTVKEFINDLQPPQVSVNQVINIHKDMENNLDYKAIFDDEFSRLSNEIEEKNNSLIDFCPKWESFRITAESNYPTPVPIISINGQSIATAGNLLAISGLQKSGKSSVTGFFISGFVKTQHEPMDGVPNAICVQSANGKAIIHIDTEQAKHRHLANLKYNILRRIGRETAPENLLSYNVRGAEIQECIDLLDDVFREAQARFGGVHVCIIDGFADLIKSVNDEESSNNLVKYLENKATEYNTLVIGIIHRNPSDSKVRGHLGSQLLRKCESVLAIKKEGDLSYIDPEELRTASKNDIPKYLFGYDKEKGYHVCVGEHQGDTAPNKIELYENLLNLIFEDCQELKRKDLISKIMLNTAKSEGMAKKYLEEMQTYEMIYTESRGIWKRTVYAENNAEIIG